MGICNSSGKRSLRDPYFCHCYKYSFFTRDAKDSFGLFFLFEWLYKLRIGFISGI